MKCQRRRELLFLYWIEKKYTLTGQDSKNDLYIFLCSMSFIKKLKLKFLDHPESTTGFTIPLHKLAGWCLGCKWPDAPGLLWIWVPSWTRVARKVPELYHVPWTRKTYGLHRRLTSDEVEGWGAYFQSDDTSRRDIRATDSKLFPFLFWNHHSQPHFENVFQALLIHETWLRKFYLY